jgi:TRAP-type C4-dicarboxylate transport system permease small subunit
MLNVIVRISSFLAKASTAAARVLLAFVAFILLLQVILRYVFNAALPWPEEAARYGMIWVVLLTGCALVRDRELITVDFFDRLWPRKVIVYRDNLYSL